MRKWIFYGGGAAGAAGAAAYELYGRKLRRRDSARPVACAEGSQIRLRDGRLLGFEIGGRAADPPVFYFHGVFGSRLEWPADREAAARAGIRLIAVDRPSYGCSDPAPRGHGVLGFADDVRQLADRLGIGRFRIIAWSAGTAYAMACAYAMPDRAIHLDLVGAVAPRGYAGAARRADRELDFFARLAQRAPGAAYALLRKTVIRRETDPDWFEARLAAGLPEADRAVVHDPRIYAVLKRSRAAGQSRVAAGAMSDLEALGGDWGFSPRQVDTPVTMWQGGEDTLTPAARNAPLLRLFPSAELKPFPGEGHFLLYRHEMELLQAQRPAALLK